MRGFIVAAVAAATLVLPASALAGKAPNPWFEHGAKPNPWKVIGAPSQAKGWAAATWDVRKPSQAKGWSGKAWGLRPTADWTSRAS